ncbi:MAG TPA: N-acetylglucosamine-6-phosphate deacetylase [Oscillospiraceae bacterium]|nr:N-acetylglucosamine-6-phosphate deacetylase [Oscillospiraceae bacterium]
MRIVGGLVFDPDSGFAPRTVFTADGRITEDGGGPCLDAGGCYVIPGLTDLHFHGCRGADFSDGDAAGLRTMAEYELSRGVTQICPACMALPPDDLLRACAAAVHAGSGASGAELVGVNLEGPFLSPAKKGAQKGDWLLPPDFILFRRLADASEGLVKLVTVAPELPGALDFIRRAAKEVTVSVGHTAADYETALSAFDAGAREVTHLFNAMPPFLHRAPGPAGAALDRPDVRAELICDGVHLHPAAVRAAFRLFGKDRIVLISDTMRAAGMPDGRYTLGGQDVTVEGPRAALADGTLAGSVTDLMACLRTAVSFGIPLRDAVTAAAVNPAKVLGLYDRFGSLEPGREANLVVLDGDLDIRAVVFRGEIVRGRL